MLHDFLITNRPELIARCRAKVAARRSPRATPAELEHGIPIFLDQLAQMLPGGNFHAGGKGDSRTNSALVADSQMELGATKHGNELLRHDFTIDQVVHDYGDLCQSITELAADQDAPITVHEFGILNIRLDNAIAGAVTEYSRQRESFKSEKGDLAPDEHLAALAHEMRNRLNTTILAISAIKRGNVGFQGATAAALDRSLISMGGLIDRALAEIRLREGVAPIRQAIEIGPFIADVKVAASLEASHEKCELVVATIEPGIFVEGDRHILGAAVANIIQNACKFTRGSSEVSLGAYASTGRIFIEVQDQGEGLPQEMMDELFRPGAQGPGKSALGIGLSLSRKGVEAMGGKLYARNVAGRGCVCIIELPQKR